MVRCSQTSLFSHHMLSGHSFFGKRDNGASKKILGKKDLGTSTFPGVA